jgi:Ca-activated chloride channel homolog
LTTIKKILHQRRWQRSMFRFAYGYFLGFIPIIVFLLLKKKKRSALKFSKVALLKQSGLKKTMKHRIGRFLFALSSVFFMTALARPQVPLDNQVIEEKGIDIGLLLDVSGSMKSVDFEPNRLEVARQTMIDFIEQRVGDRLSLIVFGGSAYTRVPLTLDYDILDQSMKTVSTESVGEEGTAIGMAISVGINRLKKSEASSKVLILVTDGENNAGAISPDTASDIAKDLGIRIYSIGVGSDKTILPVNILGITQYQHYEGGLDEALLERIASTTGGKYFRAKDEKALERIFSEIDTLEKSKFEQDHFLQYKELAFYLMPFAIIFWFLGLYFENYRYIHIP